MNSKSTISIISADPSKFMFFSCFSSVIEHCPHTIFVASFTPSADLKSSAFTSALTLDTNAIFSNSRMYDENMLVVSDHAINNITLTVTPTVSMVAERAKRFSLCTLSPAIFMDGDDVFAMPLPTTLTSGIHAVATVKSANTMLKIAATPVAFGTQNSTIKLTIVSAKNATASHFAHLGAFLLSS